MEHTLARGIPSQFLLLIAYVVMFSKKVHNHFSVFNCSTDTLNL